MTWQRTMLTDKMARIELKCFVRLIGKEFMTEASEVTPAISTLQPDELGQRSIRRITYRIVPFLIVCYLIAYLDRVNVGFAAPTMSTDLRLSGSAYGFGAGVFFLSYFLFEVPSNLLLAHYGARKWIARIMFSWGLLSASMAAVRGPHSFYLVRFLLGFAEAGFFPGVIFYLTLWFPAAQRARIMSLFILAIPLSSILGAPISSTVLELNGRWHLRGWQWLFIAEAIPAIVLAVFVLAILKDRPETASWLPLDEREWLTQELHTEQALLPASKGHLSILKGLLNPGILLLSIVYFGLTACLYALSFFLPSIVKDFGFSGVRTGCITAVPYVAGMVGMLLWSRSSDHFRERKGHAVAALIVASASIGAAAWAQGPIGKMVAFSIAGVGTFASLPIIWTLPSSLLTGTAAAGGIAIINSVGNLSGFAGTYAMGWFKDKTGNYTDGLLIIAALGCLSALIVAFMPRTREPSRSHARD